jgi:hypothetical protein
MIDSDYCGAAAVVFLATFLIGVAVGLAGTWRQGK